MASKKWARVAWLEGEREEEAVIPLCWVKGKHVLWPKGINVIKAMKALTQPTEKWTKFDLLKIKFKSSTFSHLKYRICILSLCHKKRHQHVLAYVLSKEYLILIKGDTVFNIGLQYAHCSIQI